MRNHGTFIPDQPNTEWLSENGRPDRRMKLRDDFKFIDPKQDVWLAPAGYDQMDGASIPRSLWGLVGSPYTGDYRRASIVHDYACDSGKDRKAADKMFYHACRAGGCGVAQSTLLYIGVRIGAWMSDHPRLAAVDESMPEWPRVARTQLEVDVESAYQRVTHQVMVLNDLEDDPEVLEPRVDASIEREFGIAFGR
jgi:hypothetical protein